MNDDDARRAGLRGRRTQLIGVDLGGTRLRVAAAHRSDPDTIGARLPAAAAPSSLGELRDRLADAVGSLAPDGVAAIAVTVPGLVDGTRCRWVPNLPFLDGCDLADELAPLGAPVVAMNDAHAALLAEATSGAAVGADTALLLAIGTGIGSAVLAGGRIVLGANGGACSFGWACADLDDAGDDRHGWLERHASGTALDEVAARLGLADGAAAVAAARSGDTRAATGLESVGRALGVTAAGAVALLDPSVVVVAGGVAESLDVLLPAARAALDAHLPAHLRGVPIVSGRFGSDAGLVGALAAARRGSRWWDAALIDDASAGEGTADRGGAS